MTDHEYLLNVDGAVYRDGEFLLTERSADGSYVQIEPAEGAPTVDTHERLMARARRAEPDDDPTDGSRGVGLDGVRDPAVDLDDVYADEGV